LKPKTKIKKRGWNWSLSRVKLNKIESFRLIVHFLLQRSCSSRLLPKAFNALSLYQIWQNLHANDHLTFNDTLVWSVLANWHYSSSSTTLKWSTRPAFPATNLIAHDSHFEPTVGILTSWIKGQDLAPVKTKHPSSTLYK
jgi:hypothetical protein